MNPRIILAGGIHRVWLLVIAALLAALVDPPARAQQPEAAIGWYKAGTHEPEEAIVGMRGERFEDVVRVDKHTSIDFRGSDFYELLSPKGSVSVTTDPHTRIGQALATYTGKRVRITIEPVELRR